jgi:hypothetical protein
VGALFALYERKVEQVLLVDWRPPASRAAVLEAAAEVGPWTRDKLSCLNQKIEQARSELNPGTSVVSVHACGHRTDSCIEIGIEVGGAVAVMPCCRSHRTSSAPNALKIALGHDLAIDVDRTYRMEQANYKVRWSTVPEAITPMNRVLIGRPSPEAGSEPAP